MAKTTIDYAASANTLIWDMTLPNSDGTLLGGRESSAVNNSTDKYVDIIIGGKISGPSSGAAAGRIEIYAYGSWNNGASYSSEMTGTDANNTVIAETKELLQPVKIIRTNTTNDQDYFWGPVSLALTFGSIPEEWGLWGVHNAGGKLTEANTQWKGIVMDIS